MNDKRRDNRNRILRNGETQRSDGKYCYKYVDRFGNQKFIYSWKLTPTDKTPVGKRDGPCLRDKIAELEMKNIKYGSTIESELSFLQIVDKYMKALTEKNPNSGSYCNWFYKLMKAIPLTSIPISDFSKRDAKDILRECIIQHNYKQSTIKTIKNMCHGVCTFAISNDFIESNAFDFNLKEIMRLNQSSKKTAISPQQKDDFMNFLIKDKVYSKYYHMINLLFETGLRVSEFCGLTTDDIDLDNKKLFVRKQLLMCPNVHISGLKTKSANRIIPLSNSAINSLKVLLKNRKNTIKIDGFNKFIVHTKNKSPCTASGIGKLFQRITKRYTKETEDVIKLTPHICRHTFCSNLIRKGISPKVLQKLMGHSNISTTLNIYTTLTSDDVLEEFERIQNL